MKKKIKNKVYSIKDFLQAKTTRRDFLKIIGFSTASVALSACKGPVIKSIPYIVKPEDVTPGVPTYYASTMIDTFDIGSVLVKTREGRPIKIEPNTTSKYFNTVSARIQSSLLSLYNEKRLKNPILKSKYIFSWKKLDLYIMKYLDFFKTNKKEIIILSPSFPSLSMRMLFNDFKKKYPSTTWITYDAISYSSVLDASEKIFGIRSIPLFKLDYVDLIVSFDADFLGDWCPENMGKNYSKRRIPDNNMIKHIQIESNMTLSGANADIRIPKKPSDIKNMLFEIYQVICLNKQIKNEEAKKIIHIIKQKGKKSLIISDGDSEMYELSYLINQKIDSISWNNKKFIFSKESNDKKFYNFIDKIKSNYNNIGALLIYNSNPIYTLPNKILKELKNSLKNIPLKISFSINNNETNNIMDIVIPIPHWLESWGDTNPIQNYYTLIQPTIKKVFNTRQFQDSLILWSRIKVKNYYNYLKQIWEKYIIPFSNLSSFEEALFYGYTEINNNKNNKQDNKQEKKYNKLSYKNIKKNNNKFEIRLYIKTGMGDGYQYDNPWLQEFPDPITRTTWGNYITMSHVDAKKMKIQNWIKNNGCIYGNCVNLIDYYNNETLYNIPVFIQHGQAINSIGFSFGYGQKIGKLSKLIDGYNAYKIYNKFCNVNYSIKIIKTDKIHKFACVQVNDSMMGRNLIKETDLNTYLNFPKKTWNNTEFYNKKTSKNTKYHFNLSIDLNSCIGCGSCVIACNSENNIPVVGKDEIRNFRDMHWIRVDRYYKEKQYNNLSYEKVYFQPILCQHCEKAPCEVVCPVGATTHSVQGQNMMTYNRCIGTRYCANNCPYKVRRFNWFNYTNNDKFDFNMNNSVGRMSLNPDVVIRSRGVMEKCSLCIQKTQYVISKARKLNKEVQDYDFQTACSISCPTKAITFGNINDKKSEIIKKVNDSRSYDLLDFLGVDPNVKYLTKITNTDK